MSLKSFVAGALCLACTTAPLHAEQLFIRYGGQQPNGNQQWNVTLKADAISAAAIEIGFQFNGGSILSLQPNSAVFDNLNPGQNPFTGTVTVGTSIHDNGGTGNAAFAALGGVVPSLAETLVLTLTTNSPGSLSLGGQNHNGAFLGARVWQQGFKVDGLTAALTVTGTEADFTLDGAVDGADLLRWQQGLGLGPLALKPNGDANGDGFVNGADLAVWEGQAGNPAVTAVAAAVPEPTTWVGGLLGAAMLLRRLES